MSKAMFSLLLALLCGCAFFAWGAEVPVTFADEAMVLDGAADEKAWENAPWNTNFVKTGKT